jgi:hypothetical protein
VIYKEPHSFISEIPIIILHPSCIITTRIDITFITSLYLSLSLYQYLDVRLTPATSNSSRYIGASNRKGQGQYTSARVLVVEIEEIEREITTRASNRLPRERARHSHESERQHYHKSKRCIPTRASNSIPTRASDSITTRVSDAFLQEQVTAFPRERATALP